MAAGFNRYGHRDATMILIAYRHGLRASRARRDLRWDSVDFAPRPIAREPNQGGSPGVHPLSGRELRALRRLKREQEPESPFIFTSERGAPFTTAGFRKLVSRLGVEAKLEFPVHPHMLRHACGFHLANRGVDTRQPAGLLGAQEHPAHGALHRALADPVQGVLARLIPHGRGLMLQTSITSPGCL